jgi:thioesterase domain-containing protein
MASFASRGAAQALRTLAAALGRPSPAAAFALEGPYLWALREYLPQPYSGPITLFRALEQPVGCVHEPANGWAPLARGGLEVHDVPGEHASLILDPHVRAWAPLLRARLEAATAGGDRR